MTTTATAEMIAEELRQGYATNEGAGANDVLERRLAEEVEVWHEPPVDADAPDWKKDFIMKARRAEVAAFGKMMPDYKEVGNIRVEGNDIIHDMEITGTLEGELINITLACRWTVEGGEITRMGSYVTKDTPTITKIFMESGVMAELMAEARGKMAGKA